MAAAAWIINYDGLANDTEFSKSIGGKPTSVQDVAQAVRDLVFDILPQTVEVVWPIQGSTGWGTGPRKFTEQFAYMMCFKKHVTLGFYRGGDLSDPEGLLPKSEKKQVGGTLSMRSLKLTSIAGVNQPALRSLIDESTRVRVPPPTA